MPDLLATHDDGEMEERREGERRTLEVVKILIAMMLIEIGRASCRERVF